MAKKSKKAKMFEKPEFNSVEEAERLYDKENKKFKIKLILTILAALGSVGWLIFLNLGNSNDFLAGLGLVLVIIGILSALICGVVIKTLKLVFKCAEIGWFVVPFFPADLIGAVVGLFVGFFAFIFVPVLVCLATLRQSKINMDEAERFVYLCKSVNNSTSPDVSDISNDEAIEVEASVD